MKPSSFKTVFSLLLVLCAPALMHSGALQPAGAPNTNAESTFRITGKPAAITDYRARTASARPMAQVAAWFQTARADNTLFKK